LLNILTVAFSDDLPVEINNIFLASKKRYQQFRLIERFCVEGSKKRRDRGEL